MGFGGRNPYGAGRYAPQLARLADFPLPDHRGLRMRPWTADMARPGFYDATIEAVYARLRSGMATMPDGRSQLMFQCPVTTQWGPFDAFDIDHAVPWREFLDHVQPETEADAHMAYNDLRNLRAIMSGANRSGDYNGESDGSDDGSGGGDSFIDEDGPIPPEARRGLDEYLSQFPHWRAANASRAASAGDARGVGSARRAASSDHALSAARAPDVADAARAADAGDLPLSGAKRRRTGELLRAGEGEEAGAAAQGAGDGLSVLADASEIAEAAEILLLL